MSQSSGNIVLIGMPGAGKSTLGVVLAKILNKQFLDADLVIQNLHGKTLQTLIDERGAEGFIALENEALCGIEAHNTVVATGGSAVYSDDSMVHLAKMGTVVGDAGMGLRGLYDERRPLYEGYADLTVDVDGLTITAAARKVAAAYKES